MTRRIVAQQVIVIVLGLVLLSCASQQARHPILRHQRLVKLIPVHTFFANRQAKSSFLISPDGTKLAWRGMSGIHPAVFVESVHGGSRRILKTRARYFTWAADSKHLIFVQDHDGDENYQLILVDTQVSNAPEIKLTAYSKVRVHIQQIIPTQPDQLLITHNRRDKHVFDLYRLNLKTRQQTLVAKNPGTVVWWHTDEQGRLLARSNHKKDKHYLEIKTPRGWRSVYQWNEDDVVRVGLFTRDHKYVYLKTNVGRDKIELRRLNLKSRRLTTIARDHEADVRHVYYSLVKNRPILANSMPDYEKRIVLDQDMARFIKHIPMQGPYRLSLNSADVSETHLTYTVATDKAAWYYFYDKTKNQHRLLAQAGINRVSHQLSDMKPFRYFARDGMKLHGYYTLPKGLHGPLPSVILVHGGPWARDIWGMYKVAQLLANRGYLVLQLNYRGSTGYGRRYTESAVGQFGAKMQTDLIDGLNWAVRKGLADPNAVAIVGASYGGYATLVGMTQTPDLFQCGVDIVGMSDLYTLLKNSPPYWAPWMKKMYRFIGNPNNPSDVARMRARSPIHYVNNIQRPLLIVQGQHDPRVKRDQSDRMVAKLRKAGKAVTYVLLKNEGHGFRHWQSSIKVFSRVDTFLAHCLGGRRQRFDWYQIGAMLSQ